MFCKKSRMFVCVCASALAMITALAAGTVNAEIIGTYVDATTSNTTPSTAITTARNDTDDLWCLLVDSAHPEFESGNVLEGMGASYEECPALTTTVSGLANGIYDVYVIYWGYEAGDWYIQAAVSGNPLVVYGPTGGTATGATTYDGAITERQALLGQATVTSGSFAVQVDEVTITGSGHRTWYDGVAYQLIPEPGTLALLATGLIGLLCYAWRKRR